VATVEQDDGGGREIEGRGPGLPVLMTAITQAAKAMERHGAGKARLWSRMTSSSVSGGARRSWRCLSLIGACAGMAHFDQKPLAIRYSDERGL
jgi:hypothetical protein